MNEDLKKQTVIAPAGEPVKVDNLTLRKSISSVVAVEKNTDKKETKKKKRKKFHKKRINRHLKCLLCEGRSPFNISYSDVSMLKKFMSVRGNIIGRTKSGMCAKHQRALRRAVERARHLALLPYVETGQ